MPYLLSVWCVLALGCVVVEIEPGARADSIGECCSHWPSEERYVACVEALLEPEECVPVSCLTIEGVACAEG